LRADRSNDSSGARPSRREIVIKAQCAGTDIAKFEHLVDQCVVADLRAIRITEREFPQAIRAQLGTASASGSITDGLDARDR
jgi:hypothetical protein